MINRIKLEHILEYARQQRHIGQHCKIPPGDMVEIMEIAMRKAGNSPITQASLPGGFTIEEAKELHEDLVRSHISKALSGEKMKKKDLDADLRWIHGVIVQAAWFVKASLEQNALTGNSQVIPDDGREKFETLIRFHADDKNHETLLLRANEGMNYRDPNVDLAWIFWKSSREHILPGKIDNNPALGDQVSELTMLVKRLASSLKSVNKSSKLPDTAMEYLKQNGLINTESILR
ncbi:hypothetical protein CVO44_003430 [Escherichia coli]|nr:hypothetical protein [Escherichia coli]EEY3250276.1 hypothetical protein [Escherichia coli]